jgi:uncharacterized protein YabN with tetrapyrrole methylase and pyrophosphatase domain
VRRHPHVFGGTPWGRPVHAETPADVVKTWDAVKRTEEISGERGNLILDGVPKDVPALMRAEKIQKKAAKVGFDWDHTHECGGQKVNEELGELEAASGPRGSPRRSSRKSWAICSLPSVNLSRFIKVDPEFALEKATAKVHGAFPGWWKPTPKKSS